jgi:hypothetical protein
MNSRAPNTGSEQLIDLRQRAAAAFSLVSRLGPVIGILSIFALTALAAEPKNNPSKSPASGTTFSQVAKPTASDAQTSDRLGIAVAMSGDLIVIGTYNEDGGPGDPISDAGAVYIYARDQGGLNNWGQVKKLTASDAQAVDWFGFSVAISGDTIVVGAQREDGGPGDPIGDAGAAYVFDRDQGGADNWGEIKKLVSASAQPNDNFGFSVAISGDTIVVGARNEDGGAGDPRPNAGEANVFERDWGGTDNWGQRSRLRASDSQGNDEFGVSVAISGDTIVVGANQEEGGPGDPAVNAGAAYVFGRDHGGANFWGEIQKLSASDFQTDDEFGYAVAIHADTIIVGAWLEDGGPGDPTNDSGAAYVYGRDQGGSDNWGEVKRLTSSDLQAFDNFGEAVSIDGHHILIGAGSESGGPGDPISSAGAAYLYKRHEGGLDNWGELEKLTASDAQMSDSFGIAAAINGATLVVGAPFEDGGLGDPTSNAGAGYVFRGPPEHFIYLPMVVRD